MTTRARPRRPSRLLAASALLVFALGTVVLPALHLWHHAFAHHHHGDSAELLVFDPDEHPRAFRGPHGGLLLHLAPEPKHHHGDEAPLSHGHASVAHFGVAVALAQSAAVVPQLLHAPDFAPREVARVQVEAYLLSPLKPGAPPA